MTRISGIAILFLLCTLHLKVNANSYDSIPSHPDLRRNSVFVEFLGNNYISEFITRSSKISINYSRTVQSEHYGWLFEGGIGAFHTYWVEGSAYTGWVYHKPLVPTFTLGILYRHYFNYHRSGLWGGLYVTATFGKQDYSVNRVPIGVPIPEYITYDYQIMPNLSYRFVSKNERIVASLSASAKIYRYKLEGDLRYGSRDVPLIVGGIKVGYSW